jgi:hypothetical protein
MAFIFPPKSSALLFRSSHFVHFLFILESFGSNNTDRMILNGCMARFASISSAVSSLPSCHSFVGSESVASNNFGSSWRLGNFCLTRYLSSSCFECELLCRRSLDCDRLRSCRLNGLTGRVSRDSDLFLLC